MTSDGISDADLRQRVPPGGRAANLQDVALGEMEGPGRNVDALSSLHLKNTTIIYLSFNGTVAFFIYIKSESQMFACVCYLNAVDALVVVVVVHWVVWREKDPLVVDDRGAAFSWGHKQKWTSDWLLRL